MLPTLSCSWLLLPPNCHVGQLPTLTKIMIIGPPERKSSGDMHILSIIKKILKLIVMLYFHHTRNQCTFVSECNAGK